MTPAQTTPAFEEFLRETVARGELVNVVFEQRLFELAAVLHRITGLLDDGGIAHEVVGGLAVLIHVEEADPAQSMLTRDVDLMIRRADLESVKQIAARGDFRFRHVAGIDMLLYGESDSARNAIHLLFSEEKVRPNQASPNPAIEPQRKTFLGRTVAVVPIVDLLRMKLSSYRLKDQVHVQVMDASGLITPEVVASLPPDLQERLKLVRQAE
jgi:hypothetical protein